jgi:hypothetical protein
MSDLLAPLLVVLEDEVIYGLLVFYLSDQTHGKCYTLSVLYSFGEAKVAFPPLSGLALR